MGTLEQTGGFISILMTLAIVCGYDTYFTEEDEVGTTADLNLILDVLGEAGSNVAVQPLRWWNTLSRAIDEFTHEYQLQHETTIQVTRQLKEADSKIYPCKEDGSSQVALLEFSRPKEDHRVQESVIVEIPDLGIHYTFRKTMSSYAKEKYMYQVVFPLMYQSWFYEKLSPNFYASKESEILIIENLHNSSYIIREFLLDSVEECKLVFKSIAQFHALSIAHLEDNEYSALRFLTPTKVFNFLGILGTSIGDEGWLDYEVQLLSWPIPSSMKREIIRVMKDARSICTLGYSPSTNFNVVLHGSLKPTTVYFKRLGEPSRGCKFVDFRLCRQGSPVVDFITYLMNSVEFEVFKEHHDSLFSFYLEELHKTSVELNYRCQYDLNDLQADLRRYKSYFIQKLVYNVPIVRQRTPIPVTHSEITEIYNSALRSYEYFTLLKNWMEVFLSW